MNDVKNIDADLITLISMDIPEPNTSEDGFLEIVELSHYENVNSRIYAYFLNQKNNTKIARVFLQALLDVIESKIAKSINIEDYVCLTEESTGKGRIDITLRDEINKSAVLIENKIYHHLNNDLLDYWGHFKYPSENKIGVLLTLEGHSIPENVSEYFVNIRHIEWVKRIQEIGLPSGIPHKFYIYLNDFFQTIENLSKNYEMNEQALFYFQNKSKILKANKTVDEVNKFISQQLGILASKLGLSTSGSSSNVWRNLVDKKKYRNTYYTIIFNKLLKEEQSIQIIIELFKEDKAKEKEIRELLKDDDLYLKMNKKGGSGNSYLHFAKREYKLSIEEIQDFANVVEKRIKEDFEPTMNKIMNYLHPQTR